MNSGLPSLIDAIFGKQDLASVSLDEMYEVINEFPSFNAGHFLLAKKLKQHNDAAYNKESMRTALYFNNPFWLQTLLDEGKTIRQEERTLPVKAEVEEENPYQTYTNEPTAPAKDELDDEEEEIIDEKIASEPVHNDPEFNYQEPGPDTISSFDELMSKYKLEPIEPSDEDQAETPAEHMQEFPTDSPVEPGHISDQETDTIVIFETTEDVFIESKNEFPAEGYTEPEHESYESLSFKADEENHEVISDSGENQFETREEVVNDYGVFEEVIVKKADQDMEDFDSPVEQLPAEPEIISPEIIPVDNSTIVENQIREDTPDKTDEHDYESFDGPLENNEPDIETEPIKVWDNSAENQVIEADDTEEPARYSGETEEGNNSQMQHLADRYDEQKKSLAAFNAKNAESIVFTPYHMVDYFASQGIKLVLEDNPPDNFGKQLKSFTDWLKVMKKMPVQPSSIATDEKEADRIRHFAAHSIEERDILTESMAEVLAKQGMFDNAIALYQKLSLIYPPKSAYFASRIEQLKESLP